MKNFTNYCPIGKYMKSFFCAIIALVTLSTCGGKASRLEQALDFAGENRMELEMVLEHYSTDPADSLKYRAACFLIENMPFHYSISSKETDSFVTEIRQYASRHEYAVHEHNRHFTTKSFNDPFPAAPSSPHNIVMDSHVITSAFLISNIEHAFKVWQEQPWASAITFNDFCEQVLPYRVSDEPLQDWRSLYYDYFKPGLDSICGNTTELATSGKALYDLIYNNLRWIFDNSVTSKHSGAETLFHTRLGDCRLMANYAVYAFRAVGIPCGIDMILQNPDMMYKQHYWNYMKDNSGKTIRFEINQMAPEAGKQMNRKTGKVYRPFFGVHAGSLSERFHTALPPPLNEKLIADVTDEYFPGVKIPKDLWQDLDRFLYVGVFNNSAWIPVACIDTKNRKDFFEHLEPGIAYRPLCYKDGEMRESGFPMVLLQDGSFRLFEPDTAHCQRIEIGRKYSFPGWYISEKHRSAGGRFEVADDSLFSNPSVVHVHTDSLTFNYYSARTTLPGKFKYIRYYPAWDSHNNMAEIKFMKDGKELKGKVIGYEKPGRYDGRYTRYAAFDNDPLTYCESSDPDGAWAGLELDEAMRVTEIEYVFRNDDNSIREGDQYELFYFSDRGKVSLGKRTGVKNGTLAFDNIPLFLFSKIKPNPHADYIGCIEESKRVFIKNSLFHQPFFVKYGSIRSYDCPGQFVSLFVIET